MKIPLKEFENYIDETILRRGGSYFNNGYVDEIEDLGDNVYETTVQGRNIYNVHLVIDNEYLEEYNCDCPYDLGPICKHVVAALFELQKEALELESNPERTKKPKKKSVKKLVKEILSKLKRKEIEQYLKDIIHADKELRRHFLITFSSLNSSLKNQEFYTKQIQLCLKSVGGRDGIIGWGDTNKIYNNLIPFFELSAKSIQSGDFQTALDINLSLLSEMVEALFYIDDSDGDIGGIIDLALQNLYFIADQEFSEKVKAQFLEYCIAEFKKKSFEGWGHHIDLLEYASMLSKTVEESKELIDIIESHEFSKFYTERAELIKLSLMERFQTPEEIKLYKHNNRNNSKIRKELIQELISSEDYQRAMEYAKEGSEKDMKELPGLAKEWMDWQLKIAQLQKDDKEIIRLSRYLFIDNFRNEQDYYSILKVHIAKDKWPIYLEGIIKELKKPKTWNSLGLLKSIYIREGDFESLFNIVKNNPTFDTLDTYEKYLKTGYSAELAGLYEKAIFKYLNHNISRKHYKIAVKYIRKIKKLGSIDRVKEITIKLRSLYPKRRALLQELDNI